MKKILFAIAAMVLVMVSCKPKEKEDVNDPEEEPFSVEMTIVGTPTQTTAKVKCTPNNDTCYYFVTYEETDKLDESTAASIADYAHYLVRKHGIDNAASRGEQIMDVIELLPGTNYTLCAIQLDEKGTVYPDMFTCEFTTAAMDTLPITISIVYEGSDNTVTFTPSGTAPFGLNVETREDFDKNYDTFDAETMAQALNALVAFYAQYGKSMPVYAEEVTADLTRGFSETIVAGTPMVAYAAPMLNDSVVGTAVGIEFNIANDIVAGDSENAPSANKIKSTRRTVFRVPRR